MSSLKVKVMLLVSPYLNKVLSALRTKVGTRVSKKIVLLTAWPTGLPKSSLNMPAGIVITALP